MENVSSIIHDKRIPITYRTAALVYMKGYVTVTEVARLFGKHRGDTRRFLEKLVAGRVLKRIRYRDDPEFYRRYGIHKRAFVYLLNEKEWEYIKERIRRIRERDIERDLVPSTRIIAKRTII